MSTNAWVPRELPSGWTTARLDKLCKVVRGGSPRPMGDARYFGGDIPFLKIADVTRSNGVVVSETETKVTTEGALRSRWIPAGHLVLTNSATVCVPIFLGVDACIHDGFVAFEDLPDFVDQKYFFYFFKYIRPYVLDEHKQGVTQVNLNTGIVGEMSLLLPPANEQHRIVAKIEELFSELDNGVESLTTAREKLKAYRQSLLKHAFEGKLTADWRAANRHKLESPEAILFRIRELRESQYKTDLADWERQRSTRRLSKPARPEWPEATDFPHLPSLPDGWRFVPFAVFAKSIKNGISEKPSGYGTVNVLRISAVRPMCFDLNDCRATEDAPKYQDYKLNRGNLVFTRYNGSRAFVGVAALYNGDESHVYPDKLIRCEIATGFVDLGFLEKAVNCGQGRAFIESRIRTTAGQAGISGADVKALPVPICQFEEQIVINQILDTRLTEIRNLEVEIDASLKREASMRQSILRRAFSGQLVPQDPDDEPASVLLERIRAEREADASKPKAAARRTKGEAA